MLYDRLTHSFTVTSHDKVLRRMRLGPICIYRLYHHRIVMPRSFRVPLAKFTGLRVYRLLPTQESSLYVRNVRAARDNASTPILRVGWMTGA